jgi:hypothetical protein
LSAQLPTSATLRRAKFAATGSAVEVTVLGDDNWVKGMAWRRCLGSLLRHTFAWAAGEDFDKESGLHHMAHVARGALTLIAYHKRKVGTDDRIKEK